MKHQNDAYFKGGNVNSIRKRNQCNTREWELHLTTQYAWNSIFLILIGELTSPTKIMLNHNIIYPIFNYSQKHTRACPSTYLMKSNRHLILNAQQNEEHKSRKLNISLNMNFVKNRHNIRKALKSSYNTLFPKQLNSRETNYLKHE